MKAFVLYVAKAIALLTLILILLVPISDWLYQQKVPYVQAFPTDCLQGWAHRGYVNEKEGFQENTLASYHQAIKLGATGIELDVIYDVELEDFVVSHHKPYHLEADHTVLLLSEALSQLPQINIWLDAKNLYKLWPWQATTAIKKLYAILHKYQRLEHTLVESRSAWYLGRLSKFGIHTTLLIEPNPQNSSIALQAMISLSKLSFTWGDFNGVSLGYPRYINKVNEDFKSIPAYLSTVNETSVVKSYLTQPQIKVFLTDNPKLYGEHCK